MSARCRKSLRRSAWLRCWDVVFVMKTLQQTCTYCSVIICLLDGKLDIKSLSILSFAVIAAAYAPVAEDFLVLELVRV